MTTTVSVNTYTHSVTYVADNILKSLKDIIREVGLDPGKLMGDYETNMRALRAWLSSQDLRQVNLAICQGVARKHSVDRNAFRREFERLNLREGH